MLTPGDIRDASLIFLRRYYVSSGHTGEISGVQVVKDFEASSAPHQIDGMLTILRGSQPPLVVAIKSVANIRSMEVTRQPEKGLINADAASGASLGTALLMWGFHVGFPGMLLAAPVWSLAIGWIIASAAIFLFAQFFLRVWSQYAIVPAIRDSQSVNADAYWIAMGSDEYTATHPSFGVLRESCIRSGAGLILVDRNSRVRLLISAGKSRESRRNTQAGLAQKIRIWIIPALFLVSSLWLLTTLRAIEAEHSPIEFIDESGFVDVMEHAGVRMVGDTALPELDPASADPFKEVNAPWPGRKGQSLDAKPDKTASSHSPHASVHIPVDCQELKRNSGFWYVSCGLVAELQVAIRQVRRLEAVGLQARIAGAGCTGRSGGYEVFLEPLYENREEASEQLLRAHGLSEARVLNDKGFVQIIFEVLQIP